MGTEVFELGLFKPDTAEPSSGPPMLPRTWDAAGLMRSIAWLRLQNSQGRNIYIRPQGEHNLSLVDDLKREAVEQMKRTGFQPAAIIETSPGNYQAWLKHPERLPKDLGTAAARALAARARGGREKEGRPGCVAVLTCSSSALPCPARAPLFAAAPSASR